MLLSDRRSRLKMDIIEACECLEKDEKELRVSEKVLCMGPGAQEYDFSGDDEAAAVLLSVRPVDNDAETLGIGSSLTKMIHVFWRNHIASPMSSRKKRANFD
ncbi:hypothetical protein E4U56_002504 [Claviceps arundinis]|uniref:Uncharacterized protein n=1 Tax=Claviceps arundinis TaxID=1623583 RepID=A0A9P7MR12_9HYPO|nr:hypothetical protein E4U56_002504 [Claviceps arundinis]